MNRVSREHMEVLKTLYDNGNITRQAMKSIRGQLFNMKHHEREKYLQKIIRKSTTPRNIGK